MLNAECRMENVRGGLEGVDEEAGAELGLEPGGLGGHHLSRGGDGHHLADRGGLHGEGDGGLAGVDVALELGGAADAADEVDARVGARVADAEDGGEEVLLEAGDVEARDGVRGLRVGERPREAVPAVGEAQPSFWQSSQLQPP